MVLSFPKQISERAIIVYFISLTAVSIVFMNYAMGFGFMALGCLWVIGFFALVVYCSKKWVSVSRKQYIDNVFWGALALRIVWVVAISFTIRLLDSPLSLKQGTPSVIIWMPSGLQESIGPQHGNTCSVAFCMLTVDTLFSSLLCISFLAQLLLSLGLSTLY